MKKIIKYVSNVYLVVWETHISVVMDTRCLLHKNHFFNASFFSTYIFTMSLDEVLLEWGVYSIAYKHINQRHKYKDCIEKVNIKRHLRKAYLFTKMLPCHTINKR